MSKNNSPATATVTTGEELAPEAQVDLAEPAPVEQPEPEEVPYGVGGEFVSIGGGRRVRAAASK